MKSLERCIIFRLGQRLPLKGPGLVVTFPCFDVVHIIDLSPRKVTIVDSDQMLTSDGSVVEIRDFSVDVTVSDAIKSFTQLRDSDRNVDQFIKLSFKNLIASSHVEDLENKAEGIIKTFISNCNMYINNWGWDVAFQTLPKIVIVSRADPVNPLVDAIKSYFSPSDSSTSNPVVDLLGSGLIANNLFPSTHKTETFSDPTPDPLSQKSPDPLSQKSSDPFLNPIRTMAAKYRTASQMLGFDSVIISVEISENGSKNYYKFHSNTADVEQMDPMNVNLLDVKIMVRAGTKADFLDFVQSGDTSKVSIENALF